MVFVELDIIVLVVKIDQWITKKYKIYIKLQAVPLFWKMSHVKWNNVFVIFKVVLKKVQRNSNWVVQTTTHTCYYYDLKSFKAQSTYDLVDFSIWSLWLFEDHIIIWPAFDRLINMTVLLQKWSHTLKMLY